MNADDIQPFLDELRATGQWDKYNHALSIMAAPVVARYMAGQAEADATLMQRGVRDGVVRWLQREYRATAPGAAMVRQPSRPISGQHRR